MPYSGYLQVVTINSKCELDLLCVLFFLMKAIIKMNTFKKRQL